MSSSQAGPSSSKAPKKVSTKTKKPKTVTSPSPASPELSKPTIDTDDEDDAESEKSSVVSADSENLEAVIPRRKNDGESTQKSSGKGKLP
jgi:hypothetical protein